MNQIKTVTLLFVIIAFGAGCSSGNTEHRGPLYQKILPGDSILDVGSIEVASTQYEKFRGTMVYNLTKVTSAESPQFKLFIDFVVNGNAAPDTVYFDAETLSFQSRHFYNAWGKYTGRLNFTNNLLTGALSPDNEDSQLQQALIYNKQYDHGVFEPAMLNYILGALPLRKGFKASLPMLDLNNGSRIIWANVEVEGKETLKVNGNRYEAWKVRSNGSMNKIFWISTQGNYFIKMSNEAVWFDWKISE